MSGGGQSPGETVSRGDRVQGRQSPGRTVSREDIGQGGQWLREDSVHLLRGGQWSGETMV